jgi:hypothetical protein
MTLAPSVLRPRLRRSIVGWCSVALALSVSVGLAHVVHWATTPTEPSPVQESPNEPPQPQIGHNESGSISITTHGGTTLETAPFLNLVEPPAPKTYHITEVDDATVRADSLKINSGIVVFYVPSWYSTIVAPNAFHDPDGHCYSLNVLSVDGTRIPVECP